MTLDKSDSVQSELQSERTTTEPLESGTEKRQYTIKGIEGQTLDLMRTAARKDGMKVGAWVSMRLREAADRALNREGDAKLEIDGLREHINKIEKEEFQMKFNFE